MSAAARPPEKRYPFLKLRDLKNPALLLLAALVWGVAFVAQKEGMNYIGPFTYNAVRFTLGGLCLMAVLPLLDKFRSRDGAFQKGSRRDILVGGICCGLALFFAADIQQVGVSLQDASTNVGKAGFITTGYCALVPVASLIFLKKKSPPLVWLGVGVTVIGLFCLCMMDGLLAGQGVHFDKSDPYLLLSAVGFTAHILVIDHFSPKADGVRLSCVQFLTAGLLSAPVMLLVEKPAPADILACWLPIGYAAVFSCGVGYTLQVVAQKNVHPAVASLILSLESVFSVLAGYVLMPGSTLTGWEITGCALVFAAVVMVQLAPQDKVRQN